MTSKDIEDYIIVEYKNTEKTAVDLANELNMEEYRVRYVLRKYKVGQNDKIMKKVNVDDIIMDLLENSEKTVDEICKYCDCNKTHLYYVARKNSYIIRERTEILTDELGIIRAYRDGCDKLKDILKHYEISSGKLNAILDRNGIEHVRYGIINKYKRAMEDYFNSQESQKSIAKRYGISVGTLYRKIGEQCKKSRQ